jgi:hypothetical protein
MAPGASRREVAGTSASIVLSQMKTPHFNWRTKVGARQWARNGGGVLVSALNEGRRWGPSLFRARA